MPKQSQWDPLPPLVELPPAHVVFIVRATTTQEYAFWRYRLKRTLQALKKRDVRCHVIVNNSENPIEGINEAIITALGYFEQLLHEQVMIIPMECSCAITGTEQHLFVEIVAGRNPFLSVEKTKKQSNPYTAIKWLNRFHESKRAVNEKDLHHLRSIGCNRCGSWLLSSFTQTSLFDPEMEYGTEHVPMLLKMITSTPEHDMLPIYEPIFFSGKTTEQQTRRNRKTKKPKRTRRNVAAART